MPWAARRAQRAAKSGTSARSRSYSSSSRPFSRPTMHASLSSSRAATWPGRTARRSSGTCASSSSSLCGASAIWSSAYSGRSACQWVRSCHEWTSSRRRRPPSRMSNQPRSASFATSSGTWPGRTRSRMGEQARLEGVGRSVGLEPEVAFARRDAEDGRPPADMRSVRSRRSAPGRARPAARGPRRLPPPATRAAPRSASGSVGTVTGPSLCGASHSRRTRGTDTFELSPLRCRHGEDECNAVGSSHRGRRARRPAAGRRKALCVGCPVARSRRRAARALLLRDGRRLAAWARSRCGRATWSGCEPSWPSIRSWRRRSDWEEAPRRQPRCDRARRPRARRGSALRRPNRASDRRHAPGGA